MYTVPYSSSDALRRFARKTKVTIFTHANIVQIKVNQVF